MLVALCLAALSSAASAPSEAAPVSGPRETVDLTFTTSSPGAPAGFGYRASFRNPTSPSATPPALRRLVITAPPGAVLDTSVPARCQASDDQLKNDGSSACPAGSRIGTGDADIKPVGLPTVHYLTTAFNADHEQKELLTASPPSPPVVVHGFVRGRVLDSPIPTCISGGTAPSGCPFDQVALLRNSISFPPFTTGGGATRRAAFATPAACPESGAWSTPVRLTYGDGAVETLVTRQPCRRARTRLRITPKRTRRLSRRRYRFRASVLLDGHWRPLGGATVRIGSKTKRTNRAGRAAGRIRFKRSGRRRVLLSKAGFRGASTRVRVLRRRAGRR